MRQHSKYQPPTCFNESSSSHSISLSLSLSLCLSVFLFLSPSLNDLSRSQNEMLVVGATNPLCVLALLRTPSLFQCVAVPPCSCWLNHSCLKSPTTHTTHTQHTHTHMHRPSTVGSTSNVEHTGYKTEFIRFLHPYAIFTVLVEEIKDFSYASVSHNLFPSYYIIICSIEKIESK